MEPGRTVVVCKTSKPDAISECGLMGSFENTTIISLLTPDYFMGIHYNCKYNIAKYSSHNIIMIWLLCLITCTGDDIILQSSRIPPGTYDLHIESQSINGRIFNETSIPVSISKQSHVINYAIMLCCSLYT